MTMQERDPDEVLASYKYSQLQCRVDRHQWSRKTFYNDDNRDFVPGFTRRYQTCQGCGMQRWKEINVRTFEYTGRYGYVPPKEPAELLDPATVADAKVHDHALDGDPDEVPARHYMTEQAVDDLQRRKP